MEARAMKVGQYILKQKIGEGAFAEVRLAVHETSGQEFAVKVFDRAALPRSDLEKDVRREIKIMQYLRHPGIVSIHAALVTETKMYLVMELVRGGELYDEIVSKRRVDEVTSRYYFQQLVDAMIYCHRRGVVHRDLKPENILVTADGNIKVCDFGMSWMKENVDAERATTQLLQTQCGTAKYMAPETIVRSGKGYDGEKVDAWECGMVLYALLAGYLPFNGEDDNSVFQSILRGKLKFPSHFSPGAKDVLRRLLEKDPAKRMTLPEVREHLWFLVDYKGDAAKKPAASFVLANIPSTKTKLGQSFKKSKSRGRLSQRILQGALKIETISPPAIDISAAVSLVPQRPRNKSTVRFVRDAPSPSNRDQVSWEQIVDAEGRCDGPRSDMPLTPEDSDVCDSPVACPSRESRDSTADTVPGGAPTAVATSGDRPFPGDESAVTGTVVTSGAISVESVKKPSRMTGATNILKVPSLGFFFSDSQRPGAPKGNETYPDSDVAGSPNSPVEGDVDALVSLRSRLKTPLSSMLKSMLSTSSDCQTPEAGMNDRFTAQSSWFASSPTSDAASPTFAQAIDHMMSEENVADAKVTSFKFLKRPKASPRKRGDVLVTTGQVQK